MSSRVHLCIFSQAYGQKIIEVLPENGFLYGIMTVPSSFGFGIIGLAHCFVQVSSVYLDKDKQSAGVVQGKIIPVTKKVSRLASITQEMWEKETAFWYPLQPLFTAASNGDHRSSLRINGLVLVSENDVQVCDNFICMRRDCMEHRKQVNNSEFNFAYPGWYLLNILYVLLAFNLHFISLIYFHYNYFFRRIHIHMNTGGAAGEAAARLKKEIDNKKDGSGIFLI